MYKNILAGVDSIYFSFVIEQWILNEADWGAIQCAKEMAQSTRWDNDLSYINLAGTDFKVNRSGRPYYEYQLINGDNNICMHKELYGDKTPNILCRISSEALWSKGWITAALEIKTFAEKLAIIKDCFISQVDIASDFEGTMPKYDMEQFVTYARKKRPVYKMKEKQNVKNLMHDNYYGHRHKGYDLGTGALYCTIYDKSYEVENSCKGWFKEAWKLNGWNSENMVVRVEFQVQRVALKELKINSLKDLLENIGGLWYYCTHKWLKICEKTKDKNKSRWELTEFWETVQSVVMGAETHINRFRQRQYKIESMLKTTFGYIKTIGARQSVNYKVLGLDYVRDILRTRITDFMNTEDYLQEIKRKSYKFAEMKVHN